MNIKFIFPALLLFFSLSLVGCKEKDSKIQARVEEKFSPDQSTAGARVSVNDGVATLSGEVATESGRAQSERLARETKGVKSVINNLTVTPEVVQAPVVIAGDDALTASTRDAAKDHPTVQATVNNGVITLTGSIQRSDLPILMQKLNALHPSSINNQLTVK